MLCQPDIHTNLKTCLTLNTKTSSRWTTDLSTKVKQSSFQKKQNTSVTFQPAEILNKTQVLTLKETINKLYDIKISNFCL